MDWVNYIAYIVLMMCFGYMYSKFKHRIEEDDEEIERKLIHQYLLNDGSAGLDGSTKPILWIHTLTDINDRAWKTFGSRNTHGSNQPYINLTIQSIVDNCRDSFKICLVDDRSFARLLPEWEVELDGTPEPIKSRLRQIGFMKLLYKYGGMFVPSTFVCTKNLLSLHESMASDTSHDMYVTEIPAKSVNGAGNTHEFSHQFMGGRRNTPVLEQVITYLSYMVSGDVTAQSDFKGTLATYYGEMIGNGTIGFIPGQAIGTRDANGGAITIDMLMGEAFIQTHDTSYGVWIDELALLGRTKYNWFCVLPQEEVLKANVYVAKLLTTW